MTAMGDNEVMQMGLVRSGPRLMAAVSATALAGLLAVAVLGLAQEDGVVAVGAAAPVAGIDVVSDDDNTATSLGSIDKCREVPNVAGTQFTIDVWLDAVPTTHDLDAFNYQLHFPQVVKIVGQAHNLMLSAPPNVDLSESVPDPPGIDTPPGSPHGVAVVNFGSGTPVSAGTKGVLGRYTVEVMPLAANAAYAFTLDKTPGVLAFAGAGASDWTELVSQVWDGSFSPKYGVVALGVPCGAAVTTPTQRPTSPATPTPATPTPTGMATPSPVTLTPPPASPTDTSTPSPDVGLRGDVSCDGQVDAVDALFVLRRVAVLQPFASCIDAGNVKCDDDIDAVDALLILRHVAALPVSLPPGCPAIG